MREQGVGMREREVGCEDKAGGEERGWSGARQLQMWRLANGKREKREMT